MVINCNVMLGEGDSAVDVEQAAAKVLEAVGGDPAKDICHLTVAPVPESAVAGAVPSEPPADS